MQGPSTHPGGGTSQLPRGSERQVSSRAERLGTEPLFPGGRKWIIREDEAVSPGALPSVPGALPLGHVSLGVSSSALATGSRWGLALQGSLGCTHSPRVCPGERVCVMGPRVCTELYRCTPPSQSPTLCLCPQWTCLSAHVWVCLHCYLHVAKRAYLGHMPAVCLSYVPMAVDTEPPAGPCVACQGGVPESSSGTECGGRGPVCPCLAPQSSCVCVLCVSAELWVRCVRCV